MSSVRSVDAVRGRRLAVHRGGTDADLQPEPDDASIQAAPGLLAGDSPLRREGDPRDPLGDSPVDGPIADVLRRRRGAGAPLPAEVAGPLGAHFGQDLSDVRVHSDGESGAVARALQSRAFTHGSDVYFAAGAYRPGSEQGNRLIAHEISHVVAQRSGADRSAGATLTVGRADDPAEAAADRSADGAMAALRRRPDVPAPAWQVADARPLGGWSGEIRRWPWSKKKDEPQGPARPTRKTFTDTVSGGAPADPAEASTRMASLRVMIGSMDKAERAKISADSKLMTKARTFVGDFEYMTLVAALGTYVMPSKAAVKRGDAAVHMSGAEADGFIKRNMATIGHLKGYIDAAVGAGKKADGFVAVVDDKDWARIYDQQYKSSGKKAGTDDTLTNAFIANTHPDRPAIINHDKGTRSTAIHESMHRYSELAVLNTYGSPLNEGITEYFTRLITDKDGNPVNGKLSNRTNYQKNWTFVCAMLPMLGADAVAQQTELAEIYFAGKVGNLKTDFETACKAAGLADDAIATRWTDFSAAISGGTWDTATSLLPPPAAPQQPVAPAPQGDVATGPESGGTSDSDAPAQETPLATVGSGTA